MLPCVQCFDIVGWASRRASGLLKVGHEVFKRGANDLRIVQLMPLPPIVSCFIKIQMDLTFLMPAYLMLF